MTAPPSLPFISEASVTLPTATPFINPLEEYDVFLPPFIRADRDESRCRVRPLIYTPRIGVKDGPAFAPLFIYSNLSRV